jgi:hypothetical protein
VRAIFNNWEVQDMTPVRLALIAYRLSLIAYRERSRIDGHCGARFAEIVATREGPYYKHVP